MRFNQTVKLRAPFMFTLGHFSTMSQRVAETLHWFLLVAAVFPVVFAEPRNYNTGPSGDYGWTSGFTESKLASQKTLKIYKDPKVKSTERGQRTLLPNDDFGDSPAPLPYGPASNPYYGASSQYPTAPNPNLYQSRGNSAMKNPFYGLGNGPFSMELEFPNMGNVIPGTGGYNPSPIRNPYGTNSPYPMGQNPNLYQDVGRPYSVLGSGPPIPGMGNEFPGKGNGFPETVGYNPPLVSNPYGTSNQYPPAINLENMYQNMGKPAVPTPFPMYGIGPPYPSNDFGPTGNGMSNDVPELGYPEEPNTNSDVPARYSNEIANSWYPGGLAAYGSIGNTPYSQVSMYQYQQPRNDFPSNGAFGNSPYQPPENLSGALGVNQPVNTSVDVRAYQPINTSGDVRAYQPMKPTGDVGPLQQANPSNYNTPQYGSMWPLIQKSLQDLQPETYNPVQQSYPYGLSPVKGLEMQSQVVMPQMYGADGTQLIGTLLPCQLICCLLSMCHLLGRQLCTSCPTQPPLGSRGLLPDQDGTNKDSKIHNPLAAPAHLAPSRDEAPPVPTPPKDLPVLVANPPPLPIQSARSLSETTQQPPPNPSETSTEKHPLPEPSKEENPPSSSKEGIVPTTPKESEKAARTTLEQLTEPEESKQSNETHSKPTQEQQTSSVPKDVSSSPTAKPENDQPQSPQPLVDNNEQGPAQGTRSLL